MGLGTDSTEEEEDDEDMYINLTTMQNRQPLEEENILQEERIVIHEEMELAGADPGEQEQPHHQAVQQAQGQGTPRREEWLTGPGGRRQPG